MDISIRIIIACVILLLSLVVGFFLYCSSFKETATSGGVIGYIGDCLHSYGIKVICLLVVVMTIWILLFPIVLNSPLQGHVTVDMDSICYKDGAPIPVLIQVTGPNTNLSINLSKESDHNLTLIDSIELKPEHNEKQTAYINKNSVLPGNLSGNALGEGKYSVFINTTNLTTGYYEIKSVRQKYTEKYGVKGFYLLDNS
ncbi:MAG: hypothetical protein EF812_00075 [Methanosarcinales archaeon]|nr:MAG: hypothetical protein EF812_00075 [Methanosarcinales archaeon]